MAKLGGRGSGVLAFVSDRQGKAVKARRGFIRYGGARRVLAVVVRFGLVGSDVVRRSGHGPVWSGSASWGTAVAV